MRILLISPNRERLPDPVFPIGLAYVAGALHKAGHEVHVVDLCFAEDIEGMLKSSIQNFLPDVIGISMRNIDDVSYPRSISYISLYKSILNICKGSSDALIVAGGSGFTIMPLEFMSALDIDYGVVGEGETAVVDLMKYIQYGGNIPQSIVTPDATDVMPCRNKGWGDIRPLRRLFNIKEYYEKGGMLNIQMRRGCPFNCIYCSYPRIEGKSIRVRSVQDIADEIEDIVEQTGVKHFFIVDSIFNHPREYALSFCNEIIKRGLKIEWNCYANPGLMDSGLIETMLKAGCSGIEFGTDSLVDEILENLKKGFKFNQIKKVSSLCKEHGLRFCHFIFLGAPNETLDDAKKNIERLSSLDADSSVIMVGIRIFPDTELFDLARHDLGIGRIGLEPVYYISPKLIGRIEQIVDEISLRHKNWVLPGFGINYSEKLQMLLRKSGIKGSLWEGLSKR
ncbi:MAG: lipid biosynthesis B12-binding/radical SAM protein [Nitrospirota bacterium]